MTKQRPIFLFKNIILFFSVYTLYARMSGGLRAADPEDCSARDRLTGTCRIRSCSAPRRWTSFGRGTGPLDTPPPANRDSP